MLYNSVPFRDNFTFYISSIANSFMDCCCVEIASTKEKWSRNILVLNCDCIMTSTELENYLKRIDFKATPRASPDCMFQLQKNHLLHVPFENLDILLHRPITLNANDWYKKIVENNRGGFCYELNGLFNEMLKAIGFKTHLISCRPFNASTQTFNEEFDHLAIITTIEKNQWLVDVGFGNFSVVPLKIEDDIEQDDGRIIYRMVDFEHSHLVQSKTHTGNWKSEYLLSEKAYDINDFALKCQYHQTSPQSHFTQNRVCSKLTATGRITLTDKKLKLTQNEHITEIEVADEEQFRTYLKIYFHITV